MLAYESLRPGEYVRIFLAIVEQDNDSLRGAGPAARARMISTRADTALPLSPAPGLSDDRVVVRQDDDGAGRVSAVQRATTFSRPRVCWISTSRPMSVNCPTR